MEKWLPVFLFLAALGVVTYLLLYGQNLFVTRSIVAAVFMFWPGRDMDQATVNSCSGWLRHAGRFPESRIYAFTFDAQLSAGNVEVFLLDQERRPLLKLNRYSSIQRIRLDGENRYYLRWEFQRATGKCQLHWQ